MDDPAGEGTETTWSPAGAHAVTATPWEAQASQWIYRPALLDVARHATLWSPSDHHWSLDQATWRTDACVHLRLRRYPGNQPRPVVEATIDCLLGTAIVDGATCDLAALEQRLVRALHGPAR